MPSTPIEFSLLLCVKKFVHSQVRLISYIFNTLMVMRIVKIMKSNQSKKKKADLTNSIKTPNNCKFERNCGRITFHLSFTHHFHEVCEFNFHEVCEFNFFLSENKILVQDSNWRRLWSATLNHIFQLHGVQFILFEIIMIIYTISSVFENILQNTNFK